MHTQETSLLGENVEPFALSRLERRNAVDKGQSRHDGKCTRIRRWFNFFYLCEDHSSWLERLFASGIAAGNQSITPKRANHPVTSADLGPGPIRPVDMSVFWSDLARIGQGLIALGFPPADILQRTNKESPPDAVNKNLGRLRGNNVQEALSGAILRYLETGGRCLGENHALIERNRV